MLVRVHFPLSGLWPVEELAPSRVMVLPTLAITVNAGFYNHNCKRLLTAASDPQS